MNILQIDKITGREIIIGLFILGTFYMSSCCNCGNTHPNKKVIIGKYSWEQWQQQAEWKTYEPVGYEVSDDLSELLKSRINSDDYTFLLFAGSWCGDSESEMPKIIKLFGKIGISASHYTIYGVDRDKREPSGIAEKYDIEKVPTLIILKSGEETGRIIEFPEKSWEEDLMQKL